MNIVRNESDWVECMLLYKCSVPAESAVSTFSPVGSPFSNGLRMRVCVYSNRAIRNELICGYAYIVHTSNVLKRSAYFKFIPYTLLPRRFAILKWFEDACVRV